MRRRPSLIRQTLAFILAGLSAMSPIAAQTPVTPDLPALKSRADAGDPEALNELGNLYANGRGVARNDGEAIRFYAQAADRNYAPALFNLGMMHELGRGVAADSTKAFAFYRKSAELGFALAQFNVGNMYGRGLGVKIDAFESVLWFRQAAEQGVAEAQFNLGLAYDTGRGVGADAKQALQWYRLAAEQGYPRAQYNLAVLLEEGKGGAKDDPLAARLYLAAAEPRGFQFQLAHFGEVGRDGFLEEDVVAQAHRLDAGLHVVGVLRADHEDVGQLARGEELPVAGKGLQRVWRHEGLHLAKSRRIGIGGGNHAVTIGEVRGVLGVSADAAAATDGGEGKGCGRHWR
ncbi:MAG: hypothetical protein RIS54_491 [Verrucomicrobiota bacterium]